MWILLNNKPFNCQDFQTISNVLECTIDKLVPSAQRLVNPNDYPYYCFIINKEIRSKHYKTYKEAENARNNFLLIINKIEASLPKIEI